MGEIIFRFCFFAVHTICHMITMSVPVSLLIHAAVAVGDRGGWQVVQVIYM